MSECLLDGSRLSVYLRCVEILGSYVMKRNKTIKIGEEMGLSSKPAQAFSDRDLLSLYEFESETSRKKRLCYLSAQHLHLSEGLHSTVGISPMSADALLLGLRRVLERFRLMQEFQRKASRRGVTIDMVILFAKIDSRKMYPTQKPGAYLDSLRHIASYRTPSFDSPEDMENPFSPDIEDIDQSTSASNDGCINKPVTTNTLNEDSNKIFWKI